jgi:4-amino-4-deoxy-L-arabinose transferase-like glycosyltransferase
MTAVAALLAIPFLFVGLGRAPFDDPGEGMHVEIARELAVSADPLVLTLNGVRYLDKPPLLYALLAGAFAMAGRSEAAARAVPAMAALAAVVAVTWLGARLMDEARGLVAGLGLLTSGAFFAYGRYVRPETLFVAALAGGFALGVTGIVERRRGLVGLAAVAFGLAGLAKDPVGALLPPLVIVAAAAVTGQAHACRRLLPWWGVVAWAVLGFGWWVVAEARTPGAAWYTVVDNHLLNVMRLRRFPDEDVPLSALQFLVVAAVGAAPWAIAATVAIVDLGRRRAFRDAHALPWIALALWAVSVVGGTALSPFRLPHYGLPAYPALALLAARAWRAERARLLIALHGAAFAALAAGCLLAWSSDGRVFVDDVMSATDVATRKTAAVGQAAVLPWPDLRWLLGYAGVVFATGAVALAFAARGALGRWREGVGVIVVALTMLAIMPAVASGLAAVAQHRAVRGLAREIARAAGPADVIAHEGPIENSGAFEWYSARRPVIVNGRQSVLGFGATRAESADVFWEPSRLRAAWATAARVWLLTVRAPERSIVTTLPGARLVATEGGRWLYVNR